MEISYSQFLNKLSQASEELFSGSAHLRLEHLAVLSHWLQNAGFSVPLLSCLDVQKLKGIAYSILASEDTLQAAEIEEFSPSIKLPDFFAKLPYPPLKKWDFTFIDLFAGIGGFRQAFQSAGGKCVFSSEWDKYAKKTYERNYGETPYGDIRLVPKVQIPEHDVLCAGFPCQPFSLAGVSKKNSLGRKHGFEDETQGTLFFEIKEIIRIKRPKAFMLENVKNILSHDKKRTFEVIRRALEDELGYVINWKVVNGSKWVPQNRERIYIVGYDPQQLQVTKEDIDIPAEPEAGYQYPQLSSIIDPSLGGHTLGPGTWDTLVRHKANHASKGNGFGYGLHTLPIKRDEVTRTISARYHKDGAEILIEQPGDRPRRLSVPEAMQLQGYDPNHFVFPVSATQAYHQIGNSVVVPAVTACAKNMATILKNNIL